jgi:hypothetical protein
MDADRIRQAVRTMREQAKGSSGWCDAAEALFKELDDVDSGAIGALLEQSILLFELIAASVRYAAEHPGQGRQRAGGEVLQASERLAVAIAEARVKVGGASGTGQPS